MSSANLYFLDIGLAGDPSAVFNLGPILKGHPDYKNLEVLANTQHLLDGIVIENMLDQHEGSNEE